MTGPVPDVFISYKAEDRKRLTPLVAALEAEGFNVWWDQHIGGGTNWREEIETHLDAAKVVIVIWSKRTIGPEGRFVRDEANQAQEAGHYLPITIDNVRPPLGFRELQALDLSSWWGKRDDPRFKLLADTIRHRLEGKEIKHYLAVPKGVHIDRRTTMAVGAGVALVAAGGFFLLKPAPASAKRIAVLPFANLSGASDQAYFAEGIAEELRSALSRIGLEVIGRASSDSVKDLDARAAASRLGVANILSGSVRRSPSTIRINAQLINGGDGVQHWAQTYDRAPGDEIEIQTDIATKVADALSVALGQAGMAAISLGGTADSAAHDLFLRASALYRNDTDEAAVRKAIQLLDAAIARDPRYADAILAKAAALQFLANSYPESAEQAARVQAEAAKLARQATMLAPRLATGYSTLGLMAEDRFDFDESFRLINKALSLSKNDPKVLKDAAYVTWYAGGSPEKALPLADRVIELDPLSPPAYSPRAGILIDLGRFREAIETAQKSLRIAPKREWPRQLIGDSLLLMGRPDEAQSQYDRIDADDVFRLRGEGVIAARSGDVNRLDGIISRMRALFGDAASFQYAQVYAQAGRHDLAFGALEKSIDVKDPGVTGVRTDPFLDPLRSDSRYKMLLRRLNFPAGADL